MSTASDITPVSNPGLGATWLKYLKIFRVSLIERFAYRGDFFLATILRFLPVMTTILLWEAVFLGSGQSQIEGFTRRQMIAYLLLIHISRMFSSMPGLASGIARDIREGTLKKYLLQPLDMITYLVSYRAAHKTAYIVTSLLPYAMLFTLCSGYFDGFPDPLTMLGYVLSLSLAFLIGFFFEACLGMLGFWFLEVTSLLWVITTLNYFISGQMIPLDLMPPEVVFVLKSLPFHYLAYFPAMVFLGKIHGWELVQGLCIEVCWVAFFLLLTRILYRRGLRHYSAFGG
jgi:ABC-2 type transport system permease protein